MSNTKERAKEYILTRPDDDLDVVLIRQLLVDTQNLKILVATAYDIVDKELLPNIATMAIQDFGRLNQFMMDAGPVKKEIEEND